MPNTQIKAATAVSTTTKVVVVALVATGLVALGYAAGVIPGFSRVDLTVEITPVYSGSVLPSEENGEMLLTATNRGSKNAKEAVFGLSYPEDTISLSGYTVSTGVTCSDVPGLITCVSDIAAGGSVTVDVSFWNNDETDIVDCNASATALFKADIDPKKKIKETSERNNSTSTALTVLGPTSCPDLTVSSSASADPVPYEDYLTHVFTVSNVGTVDSYEFTVSLDYPHTDWLSPSGLSSSDFVCVYTGTTNDVTCTGALDQGASGRIEMTSMNLAGVGAIACDGKEDVSILVTVDSGHVIDEISETNNTQTLTVNLLGPTGSSCP